MYLRSWVKEDMSRRTDGETCLFRMRGRRSVPLAMTATFLSSCSMNRRASFKSVGE